VVKSGQMRRKMSGTYTWIARVFRNGDRLFEAIKQSTTEAPQADQIEDMVDHMGKPCRVKMGRCGQRDLLVTGPGPVAGGSNQGKAGCVQTPVSSGIDATPFVRPPAGSPPDAMVCPRIGVVIDRAKTMHGRKLCCLRMPTLPFDHLPQSFPLECPVNWNEAAMIIAGFHLIGFLRITIAGGGSLDRPALHYVLFALSNRHTGSARPVYFGRGQTILLQRERIKRQTIAKGRLQHQRQAA
jgi:hypothetical protein